MSWRLFGSTLPVFFSLISLSLAQAPQIITVGQEERIGTFGVARLSIAADSLGQPHVVADAGMTPILCFFDKVGSWTQTSFNFQSYYSGTRMLFNPRIEIDTVNNRAWIGGPAVTIEGAAWCGLAVIVRNNVSTAPSQPYVSLHQKICYIDWEPGTISLDPGRPGECIGSSLDGFWARFTYNGVGPSMIARGAGGQMFAGKGGEKNAFVISKTGNYQHPSTGSHGVWHGAVQGYRAWNPSYQNSVRAEQGLEPVAFSAYSRYPIMGGDEVYPAVCPDGKDPLSCFIASDYGSQGGVVLNIWNATRGSMLYPLTANLPIDATGTSGSPRYPPQMAPAKGGGAFICWIRGGRVMLRSMTLEGVFSEERDICAGTVASICTDNDGYLHLVYDIGGGNIAYRKMTVTGAGGSGGLAGAGDVNGDGVPDLVWQQARGSVTNLVLSWNAPSTSAVIGRVSPFQGTTDWRVAAVTDLNLDGVADLIWQNTLGQVYTWFMNADNSIAGSFATYAGVSEWRVVAAGDIDGDDIPDLVWQYPSGQVAIWFMNTNGSRKGNYYTYAGATTWKVVGAGDINKDGVADLVWQYANGQVALWFMNANGSRKSTFTGTRTSPISWQVRAVADMDADGIADLFWQDPATGTVGIWLMQTSGLLKKTFAVSDTP